MKIHMVEQGTPEWLALRLGIPTSSEFHRIVTPKGKLSAGARKYAIYLVTEHLLNRSLDSLDNLEWVERGKELEPQAVRMYEFENEVTTRKVGFITTDDGRMGCSPDRLLDGANAALEIKCPAPHTHVAYMRDGFGDDYVPQVQGQILIGGFDYVDRYSCSPEMPPVKLRTLPDESYLATLRDALEAFCDMKDKMLKRARALGFFDERERATTQVDEAFGNRGYDPIIDQFGEVA